MKQKNTQINKKSLENYSYKLSSILINNYFEEFVYIEGKNILHFSQIRQINLLIIKVLFDKWQTEAQKLRSPYFDYENKDVKIALQDFLNTLSQYIKVSKEDFIPLVEEAIEKAIYLIIDPVQFLEQECDAYGNQMIKSTDFKKLDRYLYFNKDIFKLFQKHLETKNIYELSGERAVEIFQRLLEKNQNVLADIGALLANFNEILELNLEQLIEGDTEEVIEKMPKSFPQTAESTDFSKTQPLTSLPEDFSFDKKQTIETVDIEIEEEVKSSNTQEENAEPSTLNDAFVGEKNKESLLEKLQQAKLNNLRSAISLNQRYLFINQLFGGDKDSFETAIKELENCQSLEEARSLVHRKYSAEYAWESDGEAVQSFWKLLERKF